jgi:hypothetical protein
VEVVVVAVALVGALQHDLIGQSDLEGEVAEEEQVALTTFDRVAPEGLMVKMHWNLQ